MQNTFCRTFNNWNIRVVPEGAYFFEFDCYNDAKREIEDKAPKFVTFCTQTYITYDVNADNSMLSMLL